MATNISGALEMGMMVYYLIYVDIMNIHILEKGRLSFIQS